MKIAFMSLILVVSLVNFGQADIPLVINEFMASNRNSEKDPQGQNDDWIEIYNYGSNPIHIGGMYLSDSLSAPTKWQIPVGTTVPVGYLLIWADEDIADAGLHANFKLSAGGEELCLFDTDGSTLIDSITFGEQTTDVSYGRFPDAADNWRIYTTPTPGAENTGGYLGEVGAPMFSHSRGFYDAPFSVTIATETTGAVIRYTTDGSTPDEFYGQVYTGPVQISTTTCLRTIAYQGGWKSTNVDTQTYIFIDDVIEQPEFPPGYPDSWKGHSVTDNYVPADYGMDKDVTEDPAYASLMEEALLSIPTISIVTDKEYLFDPAIGIYMNPEEEGDNLEWERPSSAELFCPDGSMEFQINCGLRLQGGHSRKPFKAPKHSFSFRFRDIYGPTSLDYKLFGDDWPVDSFDSLHLRAGFNDVWIHRSQSQNSHAQYIYDQWMRDSLTEMGHQDALQGFFVHLYLNGIYWGIYQLHERPDADHYAAYNGGSGDEIDAINGDPTYVISDPLNTGSVSDGTIDAWLELKGVVADRDWEQICKLVDMDSFIDWTVLSYFAGTTDIKRGTNWRAAGGGLQRRPWRFYSWDAEHVMERVDQVGIGSVSDPSGFLDYLEDIEEFRIRVGDRVQKHLFNNGALTTQKNLDRWIKRSDEVQLAVIAESARWGDYRKDVHPYSGTYPLYTKNNHWIPQNNYIINNYLPRRTEIALDMFRSFGMYPNIETPVFQINGSYQHDGQVTKYSSLLIPSTTGTILYTFDGTDPRTPGTSQEFGERVVLIAENAGKRVLVPTGSVINNWKGGRYYSDISWISGIGGVGYDTGTEYRDFIDIDLYDQMYGGRTSCYIRIPFNITQDLDRFANMTLRIRYDDGFVAYINGAEVARRNFNGTPAWNSSAYTTHDDSAAVNFEDIDISSYLNTLDSGGNILAIHGLNASATSTDFLISAELVAYEVVEDDSSSDTGASQGVLEYTDPITLTESAHIKARALSGGTWSALNEATYAVGPVAENLRITELMYHPQNDPNDEFIELTNIGTETINLNLVKFTNGIDFTFPSLELAPDEYLVVVQDRNAFETRYGTDITIAGQYNGRLNNAGEKIELEDAIGRTVLEFSYKDNWRSITDGQGFSLTIIEPTNPDPNSWDDNNSWRASAYNGGSPGWDDSGIVPDPGSVVINELLAHSHADEPDWIELYNTTGASIDIGGWFLSDSNSNSTKYEIAAGAVIGPYGYIVFYQDAHFDNSDDPGSHTGFALSDDGEEVYLSSGQDGLITGYRDVEDFGASATGVSFGRYFKSSTGNYNFVAMSETTAGSANAYPKVGPVVISEIMYNPDWPVGGSYTNEQYEYIELFNISSEPVTLYSETTGLPWKFSDGIDFTFPADEPVTIPAGGYLLVVKYPAAFSWQYPEVPSENILGPYEGSLSNAGESVELSMPGEVNGVGDGYYIRVDRVNYSDGSHPEDSPGAVDLWPGQADGDGYCLTRKVLSDYSNDPDNWLAASPSPAE